MLIHFQDLLSIAHKKKIGLPAFNTANYEMTLGIVRGAKKAKQPIIIQLTEKSIAYLGLKTAWHIIEDVVTSEAKDIPMSVHLDHGHNFDLIKDCIAIGFTSVHIDASVDDFSTNIRKTKKVVDYAHRKNVFVQAELGQMLGREGLVKYHAQFEQIKNFLTDPKLAKEFVTKTGVDTLAISVGTFHGSFPGKEKIYFDILDQIHQQVKIPLVLHGASGLPDQELRKAIKHGISIVNIDTSLRLAFTAAAKRELQKKNNYIDPRDWLGASVNEVSKTVARKLKYFK
ncbi:MAG: tagatose-bisphosphate aldolase [Candidatus Komeilibacteria bacterium CG_4_10_14_0_2_um_filter_37_10]|uniref:Tagatose-bisphosphate aldolase n=1 Tax=Candidatus Komeilibacteria bacterium CG_4_10_14_0_2_um_filter_37_10 TaxID=1974470 RepID=A0A2M7VFA3_9BACT|nr:MAG: tagatose-bisphosphate aldolase [Candidatus Komeilibacteria bacterium CG_4_10_14_0_2_um_filter_37_10]PJA92782.1 MAG: tagatose-bisphosphate aldolase [Candidatus Komeilibacteria bacterium CG_4_9_14_3_um_filter_37_5]